MHRTRLLIPTGLLSLALLTPRASAADKVDFVKDIQPIFKAACVECHGPKKVKGKYRMDTKEGAFKPGADGPNIVPGKPEESRLYQLIIAKDEDDRMPQDKDPLPKDQVEKIKQWIQEGANWPDNATISASTSDK